MMSKLSYKTKIIDDQPYFVLEFDKHNDTFPEYMINVKSDYIIQYDRMIAEKNMNQYLFKHVKGELLSEVVKSYKLKKEQIQRILIQLIQALYQIHRLKIEAFLISVNNILLTQQNDILLLEYGWFMQTNQEQIIVIAPEYTRQNNLKFIQQQYIQSDSFLIGYLIYCICNQNQALHYTWSQRNLYEQQMQQLIEQQKPFLINNLDSSLEPSLQSMLNGMLAFNINQRLGIGDLLQLNLFDQINNIKEIKDFYMDYSQNSFNQFSEVIYILPQNHDMGAQLEFKAKLQKGLQTNDIHELIEFINISAPMLSQIYSQDPKLIIDVHQNLVSNIHNITEEQRLAIVKLRNVIFKQNK